MRSAGARTGMQALPKPIDVSQRSLAGGLARFLLGLEASYLAQHIRVGWGGVGVGRLTWGTPQWAWPPGLPAACLADPLVACLAACTAWPFQRRCASFMCPPPQHVRRTCHATWARAHPLGPPVSSRLRPCTCAQCARVRPRSSQRRAAAHGQWSSTRVRPAGPRPLQPQIQRCVFMGLTTGFWAIFWCISYNNVVPNHNQRFWVFFRVRPARDGTGPGYSGIFQSVSQPCASRAAVPGPAARRFPRAWGRCFALPGRARSAGAAGARQVAAAPCRAAWPHPPAAQVLLCVTLMLVVNLITCFITSLAGIKLKRMNHRARMLEVSKRVRALQTMAVGRCRQLPPSSTGCAARTMRSSCTRGGRNVVLKRVAAHLVPPSSAAVTGICALNSGIPELQSPFMAGLHDMAHS